MCIFVVKQFKFDILQENVTENYQLQLDSFAYYIRSIRTYRDFSFLRNVVSVL